MSQDHESLPGIVAICAVAGRETEVTFVMTRSRMITVLEMTQGRQNDAAQGKVHTTIC